MSASGTIETLCILPLMSGNAWKAVDSSSAVWMTLPKPARNAFEVEAFGWRSGAVRIVGAAYDPERRKILI